MQDSKIDMDGALEVNDILQPQLPWSIKRLILWWVLFLLIIVVVVASFGFLMAHFNHVNRWGLTIQDIGLISQTYLYLIFVFFFFYFFTGNARKWVYRSEQFGEQYAIRLKFDISFLPSSSVL